LTAKNLTRFLNTKTAKPSPRVTQSGLFPTYGIPNRPKSKLLQGYDEDMDKVSVTSCLDGRPFSENLNDQWADNRSQVSGKEISLHGKMSHLTSVSNSG